MTTITPYVGKCGQSAYFFALSGGVPQKVTGIASNPTISVNGSPVQAQGPYWMPVVGSGPIGAIPFASYQLSCGPVHSVVVQNGGSLYSIPTAVATGGGGSGCVLGLPVLSGGAVVSIPVTNPGSGYTSPPTIVIGGATGSGATAVPVMGGVQPGDTVTFSAAASWLTAASGAAPSASGAAMANYAGQFEPGLAGYLDFNLSANQRTMLLGFNVSGPSNGATFFFQSSANWMKRLGNPWTGAITSTPDGRPLTITGTAYQSFLSTASANNVDLHQWPSETGIFTFIADDTNPSGLMTVTMTKDNSTLASITPLGAGGSALVNPGTLVGGVQVGRVWQWDVERIGDTSSWAFNLRLNVTTGAGGTYAYTLTNEAMFSPIETAAASPGYPSRQNLGRAEQSFKNWLTTPGRAVASLRHMDSTMQYGGLSQFVDASDLQNQSSFSWNTTNGTNPAGSRNFSITTLRTYAPSSSGWPGVGTWPAGPVTWSSPNVYLNAWHTTVGQATASILVSFGGSGYTAPTALATATTVGDTVPTLGSPVLTSGVITSIPVVSAGSCKTPPAITITDSTGSGASATAIAAFPVSDPSWLWNGSNGWYVAEAVTPSPHSLKTGQLINIGGNGGAMSLSNGPTGIVTEPTINGTGNANVWVTGPNSFVFLNYSGNITVRNGNGLPGNINNVAGTFAVNYTGKIAVPDNGTTPYEVSAQISGSFSGCNHHANVPLSATDLCCAEIAKRIRDNFPAGRRVYVEYSNEPWNFGSNVVYHFGTASLGAWGQKPAQYMYNYALRASQHHQTFVNVFNQTDINGISSRGNEIVRCIGTIGAVPAVTSDLMTTFVNPYNAANPSTPIQIDVVLGSSYENMPTATWGGPWVAATVVPTGGGSVGGSLAAGTYYVAYTWIDTLSGQETADNQPGGYGSAGGASESAQFTVAAGNIPQVTLPALPAWASSANIYLTPAGGAKGSEVLYATGIMGTTVNLSVANTGTITPPYWSQVPSIAMAAASLASSHPKSIAYRSPAPWTRTQYLEWFRHYIKYNFFYNSPTGVFAGQKSACAAYVASGNQPPGFTPLFNIYEGSIQELVPGVSQSGVDSNGLYLQNQLTHDLYYDPEIYNCEMALYQSCQQGGASLLNLFNLSQPPAGNSVGQYGIIVWGHTIWGGDAAGRGDGSPTSTAGCLGPAGTAVTNQFWIDTGSAQYINNASVMLQAARDWIECTSPTFHTPLSWSRSTRPLTGPMYCSRYG